MSTSALPEEVRYTKTDAVISAIGATLLIVTEMLGAVFAFAWAVGGLFGLGETLTYALMVVVGIPGLVLSFSLTRRILRVEQTLHDMPLN